MDRHCNLKMLTFFKLMGRLPLPLLHALGWCLGWLIWLLDPTYRQRWREHTAQAQLGRGARWASVGAAGQQMVELPRIWFGAPVPLRWDGAEHIEAVLRQRNGLLLLTPHLGCFEITGQAYAQRFGAPTQPDGTPPQALTALYRPPRVAALHPVMQAARVRPGMCTAPSDLSGVRQLLKALKQRQAVVVLPDQVPPAGMGVWAPFFGRSAYTMTLAARLAQMPGTEVLLIWGERLPWARGYVVHVRPWQELVGAPLVPEPQAAAAQINLAMQAVIGHCPAQYLWGYARYKGPRGEGSAGTAGSGTASSG